MENSSLWIAPLLLLPGVGLLVLSTSTRFGQLHDELHMHIKESNQAALAHLRRRARLFRDALISLYISVALLTVSSVIGTVATRWSGTFERFLTMVAESMTVLGVIMVGFAAARLIQESSILMSVIEDDCKSHKR